jgi:hypothetical protein
MFPYEDEANSWQVNFAPKVRQEEAPLVLKHPGGKRSFKFDALAFKVLTVIVAKLQSHLVAFPDAHEVRISLDGVLEAALSLDLSS